MKWSAKVAKGPLHGLRVLDLGSGTGRFSEGFRELGAKVTRIDNDPQFKDVPDTQTRDIFGLEVKRRQYDVVVAGPTCGPFTFLTGDDGDLWAHAPPGLKYDNSPFGKAAREGWYPFYGPRLPIHSTSMLGCALVMRCREIIDRVKPRYFFIENPQGGLQTMGFMRDLVKVTVTYCQYGERRMKPTTIMGQFPPQWKPKTKCKNGDGCHIQAKRGTDAPGTTLGLKTSADRAAIPLELGREIARSVAAAIHRKKPIRFTVKRLPAKAKATVATVRAAPFQAVLA